MPPRSDAEARRIANDSGQLHNGRATKSEQDAAFYANLVHLLGASFTISTGSYVAQPKLARILRATRNDAVIWRMANHSKSWRIKPNSTHFRLDVGVRLQTSVPLEMNTQKRPSASE